METVAADTVLLISLIRQSVHVSLCRHGLMESCVEHAHLGNAGKQVEYCLDADDVSRVVEGCHRIALLDLLDNLRGDEHGLVEVFHAMHHAVTHGINLVEALDHTLLWVCEHLEHLTDCLLVVGHGDLDRLFGTVGQFELEERIGKTDFFDAALCEHVVGAAVNELVLHA